MKDKQTQKPGDWSKTLRGNGKTLVSSVTTTKMHHKTDYLAESKKANRQTRLCMYDRDEILKNFPKAMKEPKFAQFYEDDDDSVK